MDFDDENLPAPELNDPAFTSNGGSIFPNAQHFTVAGGVFTTNNYVAPPTLPPAFRMIPWGDIDLQQNLGESGVVGYRRERNCVRRVYSAKVDGRTSDMTVAVYQGDGAEEDWRRDVAAYVSMRHPNIIQICAGATYGNIHATVFHGDLVPFKQYMAGPLPPVVRVYSYAVFASEWKEAQNYLRSANTPSYLPEEEEGDRVDVSSWNCTLWIRSSTGRLSADLVPPDYHNGRVILKDTILEVEQLGPTPFGTSDYEAIAIQSLSLRSYHNICDFHLSQFRSRAISTDASVTLGVVSYWPILGRVDCQDVIEVESLPKHNLRCLDWSAVDSFEEVGRLMANGWKRYNASDSFNSEFTLIANTMFPLFGSNYDAGPRGWLSQANHIFSRLNIAAGLEDYVFLDKVQFRVIVPHPMVDCPDGYLFLCPEHYFQVGASSFKWPDTSAYWSLDPSGIERLSMEEAVRLGFPRFKLLTEVAGHSWETSVYDGLRQFHQGKGFDPESQDVARHFGYPLFRLSTDVNPPLEHDGNRGDDEGSEDWDEDKENSKRDVVSELTDLTDDESVEGPDHCDLAPDEHHSPGDSDVEPRSASPVPVSTRVFQIRSSGDASAQFILHSTEDIPISGTFKVLMNIQLALILFLATCWLRDNLL